LLTERASRFRTRSLELAIASGSAPGHDSQAAPLRVDQGIHALCKALVASEAGLGP